MLWYKTFVGIVGGQPLKCYLRVCEWNCVNGFVCSRCAVNNFDGINNVCLPSSQSSPKGILCVGVSAEIASNHSIHLKIWKYDVVAR